METQTQAITFPVDEVTPATARLAEESLLTSLERRSGRRFICLPDQNQLVVANASFHPLIEAVHRAFSDHRPLVLSPDAIWLTIQQGFAHHVNENAEALRHKFVAHKGKRELAVVVDSFPTDETWPDAIALWSASVREYIDPELHAALVCSFSTTTPTIRTASEVALLDAFQRYFDYVLYGVCGIPMLTLQGTADDWRKIRQRIELLEPYDLDWWVPRLRPILDELVKTAEGNPDQAFWQAIYKPADAYGGDIATGWITDLFPYFGSKSELYQNVTLKEPRHAWALDDAGISASSFPPGLSYAPITLVDNDNQTQHCGFLAGFLGVTQEPDTMALAPLIGWSVVEADPITVFWDSCRAHFETHAIVETGRAGLISGLPAELVAFQKQAIELTLFPHTSFPWKLSVVSGAYSPQGTLFAYGPNNLVLAVELIPIRRASSFRQQVRLGTWPTEADTDELRMIPRKELTDVRELEGTTLEVLQRLIAAEGDPSQL